MGRGLPKYLHSKVAKIKMKKLKKRVAKTIHLEEYQVNQLKQLREETRVPMAELIRQGVDLVLRKRHCDSIKKPPKVDT